MNLKGIVYNQKDNIQINEFERGCVQLKSSKQLNALKPKRHFTNQ